MHRALLAVLFFGFAAGCDSSSGVSAPSPQSFSLTGTWSGGLTISGQAGIMTWTLTETGTTVTGPVRVALSNGVVLLNGSLNGTLNGSAMTYSITVVPGGVPTEPACSGRLDGTATIAPGGTSTITGSYRVGASSCRTDLSGGNFTLTR